jgi:hypothetical protein
VSPRCSAVAEFFDLGAVEGRSQHEGGVQKMSRNQVAPGRDLYAAAGFWRRESPPRRYSARAHGIGCIRASIRGTKMEIPAYSGCSRPGMRCPRTRRCGLGSRVTSGCPPRRPTALSRWRETRTSRSWRPSHLVRSVSSNWNAKVANTAGVYITDRKSCRRPSIQSWDTTRSITKSPAGIGCCRSCEPKLEMSV